MRVVISEYFPTATCDLSGKEKEAVKVTVEGGDIKDAVLSFVELRKLLAFRYKQEQAGKPQPAERPVVPAPVVTT